MAINYELERAIRQSSGKTRKFLRAQKTIFDEAVAAGIVNDLPREHPEPRVIERVVYVSQPRSEESTEQDSLPQRGRILKDIEKKNRPIEVDGEKLRSSRQQKQLSQAALTERVSGIGRIKILNMETKPQSRWTTMEVASRIAGILETPIEELVLVPMGEVVKAWRQEKEMRQIDVIRGTRGQISKAYLSEIESGSIREVNPERLDALAMGLQVPISMLQARILPDELPPTDANENLALVK
jgi:hypothetical protein